LVSPSFSPVNMLSNISTISEKLGRMTMSVLQGKTGEG